MKKLSFLVNFFLEIEVWFNNAVSPDEEVK